jgi:aminoglycoside phosphotransferase (APT) family kinase protein
VMTGLEIEGPDGEKKRMIVRQPGEWTLSQNPRAAECEFALLCLTRSLGLATPVPSFLDISSEIFPRPYLVISYIEGQPEFAPVDLSGSIQQMAAHLAKIHACGSENLDLSFFPDPARRFDGLFEAHPVAAPLSLEAGLIRDRLQPAWPIPQVNPPALLHGDFWPGNLLWHAGRLVAVIDWEDAAVGDPLNDLAISRLDILWIFGVEAMQAFTRQYQSMMALDARSLPYWDLYAALRLSHMVGSSLSDWAAFFQPFGRPDITEKTIQDGYQFFIRQAIEHLPFK